MPLVLPEKMDNEDIEKFIKLTAVTGPSGNAWTEIDNRDRGACVSLLLPAGTRTYIDDGDIVSDLKAAAGLIP